MQRFLHMPSPCLINDRNVILIKFEPQSAKGSPTPFEIWREFQWLWLSSWSASSQYGGQCNLARRMHLTASGQLAFRVWSSPLYLTSFRESLKGAGAHSQLFFPSSRFQMKLTSRSEMRIIAKLFTVHIRERRSVQELKLRALLKVWSRVVIISIQRGSKRFFSPSSSSTE
jgi:hypothetical protein